MVHAELSAVIYDTTDKSMAHWAIHLRVTDDDDITHIVYQANGDEGELMLNVREADPASSRRFRKEIHVSDIDDESAIAEVKGILERQPMKNDAMRLSQQCLPQLRERKLPEVAVSVEGPLWKASEHHRVSGFGVFLLR